MAREPAVPRQIGGRDFWLGVWERNPRAIAFYGKSGFIEVGSHVFMDGSDAQRDLVLVSPLGTNASAAYLLRIGFTETPLVKEALPSLLIA